MLNFFLSKFDFRRRVALIIWIIGVGGTLYSFHIQPKDYNIVFDAAKWIFCSLFSMTAFFVGWAGLRREKLNGYHLKIIDLVWVSASAIAVALAAVQATQISADSHRMIMKRNIEHSRDVARSMIREAYASECVTHSILSKSQCENLRRLGISLESNGYVSPKIVGAICPRPIDLSNPPVNFTPALIQGCISAGYAAYAEDDPVLLDEENAGIWRAYAGFWPQLLIFLVALRVTKSAAEVLWKVK
ncbi:hypothetical protein [Burkholderia multivorans]|uniref:hypothetical protein n=1 Tax=Burkholderia multivorans TaxID=87883 RepID=UPI0011B1F169|nr:hypothetical protein [Burkholderia multivorans]MBU9143692.1 hypothetical protein [Burkholderia multivorans]MBU9491984.1 hypothetical protein [Burkholderia multivorans]MBU9523818.1 hypothetical protein [Burkholderia multivorans]MBU9637274.1 hypothetical protein [Burkholderia multivorans]